MCLAPFSPRAHAARSSSVHTARFPLVHRLICASTELTIPALEIRGSAEEAEARRAELAQAAGTLATLVVDHYGTQQYWDPRRLALRLPGTASAGSANILEKALRELLEAQREAGPLEPLVHSPVAVQLEASLTHPFRPHVTLPFSPYITQCSFSIRQHQGWPKWMRIQMTPQKRARVEVRQRDGERWAREWGGHLDGAALFWSGEPFWNAVERGSAAAGDSEETSEGAASGETIAFDVLSPLGSLVVAAGSGDATSRDRSGGELRTRSESLLAAARSAVARLGLPAEGGARLAGEGVAADAGPVVRLTLSKESVLEWVRTRSLEQASRTPHFSPQVTFPFCRLICPLISSVIALQSSRAVAERRDGRA